MEKTLFDLENHETAWCPGCGNFAILGILKSALSELGIKPENLVMVSGIGQAAKEPHYLKCNVFNGLHGRSLPAATAIKAVNPSLEVVAVSGDGCTYGEGGNHFIHAVRRNPDITNIVHNNMVYGLTKGQASPTSRKGFVTPIQVDSVFEEPFNPIAVAIALGASFVARCFAGDPDQTKEIFKKALTHKGYALVDVLQPCLSFNKVNTFKWFKENTYYIPQAHNSLDRSAAFALAAAEGKMGLGVFYVNTDKKTFEENLSVYSQDATPLPARRGGKNEQLQKILEGQV